MTLIQFFKTIKHFLILLLLCTSCDLYIVHDAKLNFKQLTERYPVFYSLNDVFLELERVSTPNVIRKLTDTFVEDCQMTLEVPKRKSKQKYPFIIVEGNYRPVRFKVANLLAEKLGGKYEHNLPICLSKMGLELRTATEIRKLVFALGHYVVSKNAKKFVSARKAVVASAYWYDQAQFNIGHRFMTKLRLPPEGDPIYNSPNDLLIPDILFYLDYYFDIHTGPNTTPYPNFKPKRVAIYERFKNVKVVFVNALMDDEATANMMFNITKSLLRKKYKLKYRH